MDFENYAERIKPLHDFESYKKPKVDNENIVRISVKKGEMTTDTTKKKIFFHSWMTKDFTFRMV